MREYSSYSYWRKARTWKILEVYKEKNTQEYKRKRNSLSRVLNNFVTNFWFYQTITRECLISYSVGFTKGFLLASNTLPLVCKCFLGTKIGLFPIYFFFRYQQKDNCKIKEIVLLLHLSDKYELVILLIHR